MSGSQDIENMEEHTLLIETQNTQVSPPSTTATAIKTFTTTSSTMIKQTKANLSEVIAEDKHISPNKTSHARNTYTRYTQARSEFTNDNAMGAIRHKRVYDWRLNSRTTQPSQESTVTTHTENLSPIKTLLPSEEVITEFTSPSPRLLPISPLHKLNVHAQSLFATNTASSNDNISDEKKNNEVKCNNYFGVDNVDEKLSSTMTQMRSNTHEEMELKDVHVSAFLNCQEMEYPHERRTSASMESIAARSSITSVSALMDEAQEKCAKVAYRVSFHGDSRVQQRVMTVMMNGLTFVLVERLVPGSNDGVYLKSRKVWEHIPIGQVRVFALAEPSQANKRKIHEVHHQAKNDEEEEEKEECSSSELSPVTNSPSSLPLSPVIDNPATTEINTCAETQTSLHTRVLFNNDELSLHRKKNKHNKQINHEVQHGHNSTTSLCNRGYVHVMSLNGLRKFAHWDEDISSVNNTAPTQRTSIKDSDKIAKNNTNDESKEEIANGVNNNNRSNICSSSNYQTAYSVTKEMPCYAIITERVDGESGQVAAMEWENERYWLIGCHDCHLLLRWYLPEDDINAYDVRPMCEETANSTINVNPAELTTEITPSENVNMNKSNSNGKNKNKKIQSTVKEMRIRLSQRIARAWRDWLNSSLSADEIAELHNMLCSNEWTLNFALIAQNEYEHFVDYWYQVHNMEEENEEANNNKQHVSFEAKNAELQQKHDVQCDLLKFFAITRDAAVDKGLCVPVSEAMDLFKQFHLPSVWFDAVSLQVNSAEYHVMRQRICAEANSVGGVFYGMDSTGRVIRMWKCRNYPYILERTAQEAILTHRLHGDMFVKRIIKKRLNLSRDGRLCTVEWERQRLPFLTLFANWLFTSKHITPSTDLHSIRVLRNKWVTLQHEFIQYEVQQKLIHQEEQKKKKKKKKEFAEKKKKKKCQSKIVESSYLINGPTYQNKPNRGVSNENTLRGVNSNVSSSNNENNEEEHNCQVDDMIESNHADGQVKSPFIENDKTPSEEEEEEEEEQMHEEPSTLETCKAASPLESCKELEELEEEGEVEEEEEEQEEFKEVQNEEEEEETNLQVNATDVILLVGPQGCGKSTLARALYFLLELHGYRPRWLNQDEIGNKRLFLQAIEQAVIGNESRKAATHLIIDKMNINEEMRSDYYDKLQLKVVLTVVWAHTAGMDDLAEVCIERILHRGNNHRSLAVNDLRTHIAQQTSVIMISNKNNNSNNVNETCDIDNSSKSNNISVNTMNPLSADTVISSSIISTNNFTNSLEGTVQKETTCTKIETNSNTTQNNKSHYSSTNRHNKKNNKNGMTLERMQRIVRSSIASYELPCDNSVLQLDVNLSPQHVLQQVWSRLQERGLYELPCEVNSAYLMRALDMSNSFEALLSKFPHKYTSVMLFAMSPDVEIFRHVPFALLSTERYGNTYYRQPSRKREVRDVCFQVHSFVRQPCPVAFVHYARKIRSIVKVKLEYVLSDYNTTLMIVSAVDNNLYDTEINNNNSYATSLNKNTLKTNIGSTNEENEETNTSVMLVSLSTHQCNTPSVTFAVQDDSVKHNIGTEHGGKQIHESDATMQVEEREQTHKEKNDSAEIIDYSQVASCYAILARSRQVNYDYYDFLVWNYVTNHTIDPYCTVYKFPDNTYAHFRYEFVERQYVKEFQ